MVAMAKSVDRVLGDALKLGADERARVVAELLATLEPDIPNRQRTDAEWIQEVERRARAAIAGTPGLHWAEVRAQIERRLSSR
jgi:hypothetical protein